jgi:hypothetical protein
VVEEPKHDNEFGYDQMAKIKEDLDKAHSKLRKVMKDLDKKRAAQNLDEEGQPEMHMEPEDEVIVELVDFSAYLKTNLEALQDIVENADDEDWQPAHAQAIIQEAEPLDPKEAL